MTQKFKVGDKVRILDVSDIMFGMGKWKDGDLTEVTHELPNGDIRLKINRGKYAEDDFVVKVEEFGAVERVDVTPTKKQRLIKAEKEIAKLDQQVAELFAKVEALEKATTTINVGAMKITKREDLSKVSSDLVNAIKRKSQNEQRKAIIAEAKAFIESSKVELTLNRGRGYVIPFDKGEEGGYICDLEFIVNAEKRTIVAILRWTNEWESQIKAKAIAKCAPDDVFNADIGKAIALGRALGLDVARFEQAAKPTEVVVGMVVNVSANVGEKKDAIVFGIKDGSFGSPGVLVSNFYGSRPDGHTWVRLNNVTQILDDTDSQY